MLRSRKPQPNECRETQKKTFDQNVNERESICRENCHKNCHQNHHENCHENCHEKPARKLSRKPSRKPPENHPENLPKTSRIFLGRPCHGERIFSAVPQKWAQKIFQSVFKTLFRSVFRATKKKIRAFFRTLFCETAHQKLQVPKKLQRILSGSMEGHRATWLVIGLDRILDAIVRYNTMPKGTRD